MGELSLMQRIVQSMSPPEPSMPSPAPLSDDEFRQFALWVLAEYDKRMAELHVGFDKLTALQESLVRSHAEHEVKIDKLMTIVNALKDLQRARRN